MFHTNISSLTANFEKLEMLLYEMNHKFDIVALPRHGTQKQGNIYLIQAHWLGYHQYEGLTGNSMKNGCGFYIAQNLPYEARTDLDIQYNDDCSEFQAK